MVENIIKVHKDCCLSCCEFIKSERIELIKNRYVCKSCWDGMTGPNLKSITTPEIIILPEEQ